MDKNGFPITMLVTIFFGVVWAILLSTGDSQLLVVSFVFYALFRTFLYTFIFSYLADKLGFKYFGILVGIMFFVSGIFGLLQYPLSVWAGGTCITAKASDQATCSHGQWALLNHLTVFMLMGLLYFPYQDYVERQQIMRHISSKSIMSREMLGIEQVNRDQSVF
jgi:hypothetical protein